MHSFLIISKDPERISKKTENILSENKIDTFDRNFYSFEKQAGIEEIKKTSENLHLTPFKSEKKAIILNLSLGITPDAQNSLLKTLEEPPKNTIIILTGINKEDFLPTILSRCSVFEIGEEEFDATDEAKDLVNSIIDGTDGEKMEIAQVYGKDREMALNFVEETVLTASEMAKKEEAGRYLALIKNLNQAYSVLKIYNVNPRLVLENTLLKF
jgi:DNA polymerase III delta prime subunit